jgi:parvulin-like peptidyl-prolyl isomerase
MATAKKTAAARKTVSKASVIKTTDRSSATIAKNNKTFLIIGIVVVLAVIAFLGKGLFIAAMVNGQPISRLSIISELEKQSGKAALDKAITRSLVFQEAAKKHVSATNDEITKEIARIDKQFKSQGQNLDQLLTAQGISKSEFNEDIKVQIVVQKILGDKVKVSEKEFSDFLDKNKDLIANEKDQETAKINLKLQLEQQKLAQKYQEWIAALKKDAKIQHFLGY